MAAKETVLNDNASIYQKRVDKSEKQKWGEMDRKERIVYFNEYYRGKVILSAIGIAALVSLLYSIFGPSTNFILYAAVVNDYWNDEATEAMQDDLKSYLGSDSKWEDVRFDYSYYLLDESEEVYNTVQKLVTYMYAGEIDLIIADEGQFAVYAEQDYFYNLEELLPTDLYEVVREYLVYYTSEETGKLLPVGIELGTSKVFQSMNGYQEEPLLGIMANSENVDYVIDTIRYFFQK